MASHDAPVSLLGHLYSFNTLRHSPNLIYLVEPTVENASITISSSIPWKVVLYTYSTLRMAPQVILILVKTFGGAILKHWNARWSFIILDPYNKRWRFKPYKEADLPSTEDNCMPSPWWHKQHAAKEIPNPDMTFSEISLRTYNNYQEHVLLWKIVRIMRYQTKMRKGQGNISLRGNKRSADKPWDWWPASHHPQLELSHPKLLWTCWSAASHPGQRGPRLRQLDILLQKTRTISLAARQ